MARPIDPELRENLTEDVLEAVARLGLGNLSLRALSRELGVSPRMLLYHFGSRDGLLDAVVSSRRRSLASGTRGSYAVASRTHRPRSCSQRYTACCSISF